MDINTINRTK